MADFQSILSDVENAVTTAIRQGQIDPGTLTQVQVAAQRVANQAQVGAAASQGARTGQTVGSGFGVVGQYVTTHPLILYGLVGFAAYRMFFRRGR